MNFLLDQIEFFVVFGSLNIWNYHSVQKTNTWLLKCIIFITFNFLSFCNIFFTILSLNHVLSFYRVHGHHGYHGSPREFSAFQGNLPQNLQPTLHSFERIFYTHLFCTNFSKCLTYIRGDAQCTAECGDLTLDVEINK